MRLVEILGLEGLPEVKPGDDLARLIEKAIRDEDFNLRSGDIIVVSQKVVSKAEGRVVRAVDVEPSPLARNLSEGLEKSSQQLEVILQNTARVVRMDRERGVFIMETPHGFVCANAGVDRSNVGREEAYTALPVDPDSSAGELRARLEEAFGTRLAVIITDTFGRPWRVGQTDVALGFSGIQPFRDYQGKLDPHGYELKATKIAVVDEVAAAAELVKGKLERIPVAIVRGLEYETSPATSRDLIRSREDDLFR